MTQEAAAVVRVQMVVEAPIERAFSVFTERFGDFKPPEHNLLGVELAETVFEPRVGGEVYDRGVDGSVCRWARVLAYEPPDRVVISWDIDPQWQIETDFDKHGALDRHGEGWEAVREGVDSAGGWPLYLRRFADVAVA